jgi:hypothetical protein
LEKSRVEEATSVLVCEGLQDARDGEVADRTVVYANICTNTKGLV